MKWFGRKEETKPGNVVTVDESRFRLMPKEIAVPLQPVEIPMAKRTAGVAEAISTPVSAKPRWLVWVIGLAVAVVVAALGATVYWYVSRPAPQPLNRPAAVPSTPVPITVTAEAKDGQGRTLGSLALQIPASVAASLSASSPKLEAMAIALSALDNGLVVGGKYQLSPSGFTFSSPVILILTYFDTDIAATGGNESSLIMATLSPDGSYQPIPGATVDVNQNQARAVITSLPSGIVAVVSSQALTKRKQPTPSPELPVSVGETLRPATDTDNDGLTDSEETLYRSDSNNPDSDGDSYLDGTEVRNLYSPGSGNATALLIESGLVKPYRNDVYGYQLLYPSSWAADSPVGSDGRTVLFTPPETGEVIEILALENDQNQQLLDWYVSRGGKRESVSEATVNGLTAITGLDGSFVYVAVKGRVYGMFYLGVEDPGSVNFLTTFAMMRKSWTFNVSQ
ncbi:MAG: hypothetical protein V1707_01685 [bacterium]